MQRAAQYYLNSSDEGDVSDLFSCESDFLLQTRRDFSMQQKREFPCTPLPTPRLFPKAHTDVNQFQLLRERVSDRKVHSSVCVYM
jgi:hypothetical protein